MQVSTTSDSYVRALTATELFSHIEDTKRHQKLTIFISHQKKESYRTRELTV